MIERVTVVGTGLIGASIGLALKANSFHGSIAGWDSSPAELAKAAERGAIDLILSTRDAVLTTPSDLFILATPVLPILDWMQRLSPALGPHQLVTDVGSTKCEITSLAGQLYNRPGTAHFLPGHPMAGKELGGAALADPDLFRGATWLFTGNTNAPLEQEWRAWVARLGATSLDMDPQHHDEVCAWVSHLPQYLSTALAALLQETFGDSPQGMAALQAIGGRALRETTRLGSSPYSMWRDVAITNTSNVAATLHALELRLAHLRENLRTPELREQFATANKFRTKKNP